MTLTQDKRRRRSLRVVDEEIRRLARLRRKYSEAGEHAQSMVERTAVEIDNINRKMEALRIRATHLRLADVDSAFDRFAHAAQVYLKQRGWAMVVAGPVRIEQVPHFDPKFKFRLVMEFVGGRQDGKDG